MNQSAIAAGVACILATLSPVHAVDRAPTWAADSKPVAAVRMQKSSSPPAEVRIPADVDARPCLELPTNEEIIACAEKYRSRPRGG